MTRIETGSCFCGTITAEMHGDPFWICSDHDDDCRKAIGSPLTVWVGYRPAQFRLLTGTPKTFSRTPGVLRTFCADCGTSIAYLDQGLPEELYVTIGFFDRPERFAPQAHAYWDMKLPWVEFRDDLPRVGRYSRRRDPAVGNPADR
ncbi:GFA family protein [Mesorhizobium sp.]|uniref:GFA family protein n=1 Tax=Mesorhizobium sp. TaxID=1871066 RepID=UPI000FE4F555|nr:GFA family protein [Mesorhizobium sp.]RWE57172.1 MAG: GFA family protein [Mesorhizobium sp.]